MKTASFYHQMNRLRRWRRLLWGLLLGYVPIIWLALELSGSDRTTFKVFAGWVLLVLVTTLRVALLRCPRCDQTFHLHGFIPLYLRRCLHCGLHISARCPD